MIHGEHSKNVISAESMKQLSFSVEDHRSNNEDETNVLLSDCYCLNLVPSLNWEEKNRNFPFFLGI